MTDRSYDDKQVALILRRAAELQSGGGDAPAKTSGFSLRELEEIALEAGIDPENIRLAAQEIESGAPLDGEWAEVFGAPLTLRAARDVPGEVTESIFDEILVDIQNAGLGHGHPSVVGNTLTWRTGGGQNASSLQITVAARDGRTEIRAEERRHQMAGGLFGGVMGGGGLGLGLGLGLPLGLEALASPLFAFLFPVGVVALSYGVARGIFRSTGRRRHTKLTRLVDTIAEMCRKNVEERRLGGADDSAALPEPGR